MRAITIRVFPGTGHAIDGNADGLEEDAVGGAGRHGRNERHTWKVPPHELLRGPDDLRIERWRYGDGSHRRHWRHLDAGIGDGGRESGSSPLHGLAGEDATVRIGRGTLGQRIVRVPALEERRDAGRAQYAVVDAIPGAVGRGRAVRGLLPERNDGGPQF